MLTQDQKQKFIACLEQKMKVKLVFQWEDFLYFQYIGCSETGGAAAYIAGAKDTARIPMEKLQVLVEYPTVCCQNCMADLFLWGCIGYCITSGI